jgi:hypothetical protein
MIRRADEAIFMPDNEVKNVGTESRYLTITVSEWVMF